MAGRIVSKKIDRTDKYVRVTVVDDRGNIGIGEKVSSFGGLAKINSSDEAVATSRAIRNLPKN